MGMFDSVHAKCPQCGEESEFQSKAGACNLANYHVDSHLTTGIPDAVGKGVYQQGTLECHRCHAEFYLSPVLQIVAWRVTEQQWDTEELGLGEPFDHFGFR